MQSLDHFFTLLSQSNRNAVFKFIKLLDRHMSYLQDYDNLPHKRRFISEELWEELKSKSKEYETIIFPEQKL